MLRAQPRDRQDGRDRRGGRRHRRPVDRRAGHAAHHADLPLRRHGVPRLRAVEALGDEPGRGQVPQRRHGRVQGGRAGRRQPQRQAADRRTTRGASRSATRSPTARTCRCTRAQRSSPAQELVEWDPFTSSILSEIAGKVEFQDIVEGENVREETDKVTGLSQRIIVEASAHEKRVPAILVRGKGDVERRYLLPSGSHLVVAGQAARSAPATCWSRSRGETTKTKDITGGLPRVVELFEARTPKEPAIITEIDGTVRLGEIHKGMRKVHGRGRHRRDPRVPVPRSIHVNVQEGERVRGRRPADRRADQPARHPAGAGREGAAALPGGQDPGGLPLAERRDQRQAHRGDRAPDDALGEDRGGRATPSSWSTSRSTVALPRGERARRSPPAASPPSAGRCCSASPRRRCRPTASSRRRASRRRRGCSPRRRSPARSTTCGA